MLNSLRKRPLEPPSSVTVTTAVKSLMRGSSFSDATRCETALPESWCGAYCFKPCSKVESPVPPPSATMRNARNGLFSKSSLGRRGEFTAVDAGVRW